jgi:hypothetical protein
MIEIDYLRECFIYEPNSGSLIWKERPINHFASFRAWRMANGKNAGKEAGSMFWCKSGVYRRVKVNGHNLLVHRIIVAMHYGNWPDIVDHANGDGLDNRIDNLRNVDRAGNMRNRAIQTRNTSRVMGVHWFARNKRWGVIIASNHKREFLGLYEDWFDAVCCRKSAEISRDFHSNHGRRIAI